MCLLVLAWNAHPRYRLIVAANRDEYHERPAAALDLWPAPEHILAGRDLRAGGTWMGLDRRRRFGVVTNFRDLVRAPPEAPSRGRLVPRYLVGTASPGEYLAGLEREAGEYGGFNLLLADGLSLWYASNRNVPFARTLPAGVYGLSNERLDIPWPKLRRVRRRFEAWLAGRGSAETGELFALLEDREPASEGEEFPGALAEEGLGGSPGTGLAPEWERTLSAPFVLHPDYGTRCSTVLAIGRSDECYLAERRFDPMGERQGETQYRLAAGEWP